MADEFSTELADGLAYVAGHDDDSRPPVMIIRIKEDYLKHHSQKQFTRLLVFTLEVAIQTMAKNVEQFVILFDASPFSSASSFIMNVLHASLRIIADYYPGRLHKAFVIDPPSLFSYLWKGMRPFVELSPITMMVSSIDFDEASEFEPRAASLRLDPLFGSCSSSRFAFTMPHHLDSLKPCRLSFANTYHSSAVKLGSTISPLNARSHSFTARMPCSSLGKGHFQSTQMPPKTQKPKKPILL